ncbi:hypothetical protein [Kutzneria buriramensis]|uniref:Uncharacterized protein n=1 Tax=Kutzneria buriramensis TaxID=1045776 RepID=A0A3E0GZV5_9PSEU|nr:hypothetical protein [Kutzneria buriramensis]REH36147.1 hypothetical protein BCF44_11616 [Kutzneria buriramensis]
MNTPQPGSETPTVRLPAELTPRQRPPRKGSKLTPVAVMGLVADAGGVVVVVSSEFNVIVTVLVLLAWLGSLSILIARRKKPIDRTNWAAIICMMAATVLLTIMVPRLPAQGAAATPAANASTTTTTPATTTTTATTGTNPTTAAASNPPTTTTAATPRLIYSNAVVLNLHDGIDLENNGAITHNLPSATGTVDLYIDTSPGPLIVVPNANHNQIANYSGPNQDNAAKHCPIDLKGTSLTTYAFGNIAQQFCFVTSDGHVGFFVPTKELDDAVVLTVRVWDEPVS